MTYLLSKALDYATGENLGKSRINFSRIAQRVVKAGDTEKLSEAVPKSNLFSTKPNRSIQHHLLDHTRIHVESCSTRPSCWDN
jgi:hypothetical protein